MTVHVSIMHPVSHTTYICLLLQIGVAFLVLARLGSHGQRTIKWLLLLLLLNIHNNIVVS